MQTLPNYVGIIRDGYSEEIDYNIQQSGMDNGLKKQRPGRSIAIKTRKCEIVIIGHANKQAFLAWLKTIGNGTQRFNYTDPVDKVVKQCRFINQKWEFSLEGLDVWKAPAEIESVGD